MGSDLYRVQVVEKLERSVKLHLQVIHPDSNSLSDNTSFALMLLHESAMECTNAPLAQEVSFEDTLDSEWLRLYASGFVEQVEVAIRSGSPDAETEEDWLKGTVTITVTDPAWVAHLQPGAEFASRAFNAAYDFEACEPIRPGQVDPNAPVPEAFVAMPGALWKDSGLPAVVRAAAYSASAYRSANLEKGKFDAKALQKLDGQVVLYQGEYDRSLQVGLLSLAGAQVRIFTVSDGAWGSSETELFDGSIGLAELIPGKRRGSKLSISSKLRHVKLQPQLRSATVEGAAVVFRIGAPFNGDSFDSVSDDELPSLGFQALVAPLLRKGDVESQNVLAPCPLSWTIEREVMRLFPAEERQVDDDDGAPRDSLPEDWKVAARLSRGFIAKTEVVSRTPPPDLSDLDDCSEAQARALLLSPWPEVVVKVTPHHAAYLQHLAKPIAPVTLPFFSEAEAWEHAVPAPETRPTGFGEKPPA